MTEGKKSVLASMNNDREQKQEASGQGRIIRTLSSVAMCKGATGGEVSIKRW